MTTKRGVRRLSLLLMIFSLFFSVSIFSEGQSEEGTKQYKIKVATWYAEGHPQIESLKLFKDLVETKTGKGVVVEVYPSSQLGSEEAFIDGVKRGTIEMGVPGMMTSKDLPKIAIAEMPFLFDGWEHARDVLTGSIGQDIVDGYLEETGVRVLAWTVNGFREISSNYLIDSYDDLENMRIRVPGVEYYVKMAQAFNANPTPMAFSELFTALETKVVDGQDNPYPTVRASGLWEVQSNILDSKHIFSPNLWIINEQFFQSLPDEFQTAVLDSAKEAQDFNWATSIAKDKEDMEWLIGKGLNITIPDAEFKSKLRDSQQSVYDWFYVNYPGTEDIAEKIREMSK